MRWNEATLNQNDAESIMFTKCEAKWIAAIRRKMPSVAASNTLLVGWPDEFVHLQLETHGQRVGDDFFHQLLA